MHKRIEVYQMDVKNTSALERCQIFGKRFKVTLKKSLENNTSSAYVPRRNYLAKAVV